MYQFLDRQQWRIQDFPLGGGGGGADLLGGANLRHVHFLAKMYVKMKEIDPVGGGGAPPGSANGQQSYSELSKAIVLGMLFNVDTTVF